MTRVNFYSIRTSELHWHVIRVNSTLISSLTLSYIPLRPLSTPLSLDTPNISLLYSLLSLLTQSMLHSITFAWVRITYLWRKMDNKRPMIYRHGHQSGLIAASRRCTAQPFDYYRHSTRAVSVKKHVARTVETWNAIGCCNILIGKSQKRHPLGRLSAGGRTEWLVYYWFI